MSETRTIDMRETVTWDTSDPSAGPFADYEDFLARGQRLRGVELLGYLHHENLIVWLDASAPDYERPALETFLDAIAKLPKPEFLYKVIVLNHVHPLDAWVKQIGGGTITSENRYGDLCLYRPSVGRLYETLAYEWGLVFLASYEEVQKRFRMALDVEPLPLCDAIGRDNPKLMWARLIECFLPAAPWPLDDRLLASTFELIVACPIHSAIFGRALRASLEEVDPRWISSHHAQHIERADFIAFSATQLALERLRQSSSPSLGKLVEWLEAPVDSWLLEWPLD